MFEPAKKSSKKSKYSNLTLDYRFPAVTTPLPESSPSETSTLSSISAITTSENTLHFQGMTSMCMSGNMLLLTPSQQDNPTNLENK